MVEPKRGSENRGWSCYLSVSSSSHQTRATMRGPSSTFWLTGLSKWRSKYYYGVFFWLECRRPFVCVFTKVENSWVGPTVSPKTRRCIWLHTFIYFLKLGFWVWVVRAVKTVAPQARKKRKKLQVHPHCLTYATFITMGVHLPFSEAFPLPMV